MKKRALALVLGASMIMGLAACGSSSAPSKTPASTQKAEENKTEEAQPAEGEAAPSGAVVEGEGQLNIWLAGKGEVESNTAYKQILDGWVSTTAPGYTYELSFIPWSEYFTKLSTALASGEGPDVFMTGYGQLGTMTAQGYTANLSEILPSDWSGFSDIPENILSAGMSGGNVYGILEPSTRIYYYRKDIAEAVGATEEELTIDSLDKLQALANKMCFEVSGTKIAGFHIPNAKEESIEQWAHSFALNYDPNFTMWDAEGHATFNTEAGAKALEFMNSMLADGYNITYEAGFDQFSNGVCSIYLTAESMYRSYANTLGDENVGILPCTINTLLIGNFITVNSGSKNMEAAASCLAALFTDDAQKIKASLGMFPSSSTLWDWYTEEYPEYANVPTYYEHSYAYSDTLIPPFTQVIQEFRAAAAKAMETGDVAAALEEGAAAWNAIVDGTN